MAASRLPLALLLAAATLGVAATARAELGTPAVGDVHKWVCQGDGPKSYAVKIQSVLGGVLRYEDQTDGEIGWVEKPVQLNGLELFAQRDLGKGRGQRRQVFDTEDFAAYAKLEPGSSMTGDVEESDRDGERQYEYTVTVGEPREITHEVLGSVTVVPVTEKRWVYYGKYSSTHEFLILPERSLVVSWTMTEPDAQWSCDLYLTFKR
jgi:hypothetical protein